MIIVSIEFASSIKPFRRNVLMYSMYSGKLSRLHLVLVFSSHWLTTKSKSFASQLITSGSSIFLIGCGIWIGALFGTVKRVGWRESNFLGSFRDMIKKRMVVTLDKNSELVSFTHDVSGISEMKLEYFKMVGLNPAALPPFLYLKIDHDVNVRSDLVVSSGNTQTGSGFVRPSSSLVPLYYKLGHAPDVIHGKQCKHTGWSHEALRNMTNFRVTLEGGNGAPIALDPGVIFQLVFIVKYQGEKTWGDSKKNLQAWT